MIRLFRVSIPVGVFALLLSEIILTSCCFCLAAYWYWEADLTTYFLYDGGLVRNGLVVASIILGMHFSDLYTRIHVKSKIALLAQGLISYAAPHLKLGRQIMLMGTVLSFFVLFSWRLIYAGFLLSAVTRERLLFVGSNQVVKEMAEHIAAHAELGLAIIGYLVDGQAPGTKLNGANVLGPVRNLRNIATKMKPTRIVVGMTERRDRM